MSQPDKSEIVEVDTVLDPTRDVEIAERRDPTEVERFLLAEGVIDDFEAALNFLVKYQEIVYRLNSPDPQYEQVSRLLRKYQFVPHPRRENYAILLDGREISDHTDSIPGDAELVETETITEGTFVGELESGE